MNIVKIQENDCCVEELYSITIPPSHPTKTNQNE